MSITTKEIAEMVGVSRQAVSAVLNGHPGKVSAEKRRKIFLIAKHNSYRPNMAAMRLAGHNKTRFVGIDIGLFPPIKLSVLQSITMQLAEQGIQVRLTSPGDKKQKLNTMLDFVNDGAMAIFTDLKTDIFDVEKFPAPLVIFGNKHEPCDLTWDYAGGVELVVKHLHQKHGHQKIGIVCADTHSVSCGKELMAAWQRSLAANGLNADSKYHIPLHYAETPIDYAEKLIRQDGVTAFICEHDAAAAKLIVDLAARGIRVPEDVAIVGNGASYISELTATQLSSIYLPVEKYAAKAIKIAMQKINGTCQKKDSPYAVPTGLFLGGSCGCPAAERSQFYWEAVPLSLEDQIDEIHQSGRYESFTKHLLFE